MARRPSPWPRQPRIAAFEIVCRMSRRRRLGQAERPGIHARPGNNVSLQPMLYRPQGSVRLYDLPRPTSIGRYECFSLRGQVPRLPWRSCKRARLLVFPGGVDSDTRHHVATTCPVNPIGGCISCHMPKVDDPSRRSQFTDHHIRVHRTPFFGHTGPRPESLPRMPRFAAALV